MKKHEYGASSYKEDVLGDHSPSGGPHATLESVLPPDLWDPRRPAARPHLLQILDVDDRRRGRGPEHRHRHDRLAAEQLRSRGGLRLLRLRGRLQHRGDPRHLRPERHQALRPPGRRAAGGLGRRAHLHVPAPHGREVPGRHGHGRCGRQVLAGAGKGLRGQGLGGRGLPPQRHQGHRHPVGHHGRHHAVGARRRLPLQARLLGRQHRESHGLPEQPPCGHRDRRCGAGEVQDRYHRRDRALQARVVQGEAVPRVRCQPELLGDLAQDRQDPGAPVRQVLRAQDRPAEPRGRHRLPLAAARRARLVPHRQRVQGRRGPGPGHPLRGLQRQHRPLEQPGHAQGSRRGPRPHPRRQRSAEGHRHGARLDDPADVSLP